MKEEKKLSARSIERHLTTLRGLFKYLTKMEITSRDVTKGIDNEVEDPEINEDDIYGKVIYHTILFSFVGRLMTNIVVYYLLFISVGVAFAYEVVSSFLIKKDDEE